jgi:hypothetical protein
LSRDLIVAGYLVIALAAAALEVAARLGGRFPTLGEAVSSINAVRGGRLVLLAVWLWAGWHFFVRASWG